MTRKRDRRRMPALDIGALEVFVAVVHGGSMTRAAERLGLTQPAVSMAVRQLERELGSTLVDRSMRPLKPTRAGMVLARRAGKLLAEAEGLWQAVSFASDETLPSVRLGLVDSFAVTAGAPLIRSLQGLADELRVWSGLTPDLAHGLLERELDMLITSDPMEDVADLRRDAVLHEPFVLALPPGRAADAGGRTLAALAAAMPLVRYTSRSIIGATIERHLRRFRIDAPRRLEFDASESVLSMVSAGLGWAITTPLCLLQGRADFERLEIAALSGAPLTRELYLVSRAGELPGAAERIRELAVALLHELLTDAYARRLPWMLESMQFG